MNIRGNTYLISKILGWIVALLVSIMPQLYPLKVLSEGHNFAANGVSSMPAKDAVNEKSKLYSKNFFTKLKNKTMSIPSEHKEDIMRPSPEKQKLPVMSSFRRMQLEDIREHELAEEKKYRLFFYINQKFVNKFGSAHKNSIAASVEDFLEDNQNIAIDVHDLRLLDAIINDSILKKGELDNTQSSDMSGGRSKRTSSGFGSSKKTLTQSMTQLPLGADWTIIRQHRSLGTAERIESDLLNTFNVRMRRQDTSDAQLQLDKEIAKIKEIENYRTAQYMDESMKILSHEELRERKSSQKRKEEKFKNRMVSMAEKVQRENAEKEALKIIREKKEIHSKQLLVELEKKEISARLRAVAYKEKQHNLALDGDTKSKMSMDERVREDSEYRRHIRMPASDSYRLTRRVIEDRHMEEKNNNDTRNNSKEISDSQNFRQMEEKEFSKYLDERLVEFKLSSNTFKKTVIKKQEEHKKELKKQAEERTQNITLFNKTDTSRCNAGKNPSKIGNMTFTLESFSLGKTA